METKKSHPSRVRGLKQKTDKRFWDYEASHPSRVRGLKHSWASQLNDDFYVAPFTGAWIETKI